MRCPSVPFVVQRVGKIRFSIDGFKALVKGQANVACTSSRFTPFDAKDYLDAHGHLPLGYRVGWDAYAAYVHPDNPVKSVTTKQFKEILRGQIQVWSALGGPAEPITLYGLDRNSRGGRLFKQVARLFMAAPPWKEFQDSGGVIDAVKADPWGIGLAEVGYSEAVPYLGLKGVFDVMALVPDTRTLNADKWPLLKTIWLWTADPPDESAGDLIQYLYSDRGQQAIRATGYTPIPREQGETRLSVKDLPSTRPADTP
ncbi:MAG: substrate-binding domain-containing protein [Phycisphaerae bacterium]|nr:substrate-binding domain-containing protein [Phycisphaerae bacterium]